MTLDEFIIRWQEVEDPFWDDMTWEDQIDIVDKLVKSYIKQQAEIVRLYLDNPLYFIGGPGEFRPVYEEDDDD